MRRPEIKRIYIANPFQWDFKTWTDALDKCTKDLGKCRLCQLPSGIWQKAACSFFLWQSTPNWACQFSLNNSIIAEQVKSCQSRIQYFQCALLAGGFEQSSISTKLHLIHRFPGMWGTRGVFLLFFHDVIMWDHAWMIAAPLFNSGWFDPNLVISPGKITSLFPLPCCFWYLPVIMRTFKLDFLAQPLLI